MIEKLGEHLFFMKQLVVAARKNRFEHEEFFSQLAHIGVRSLPTTCTAGLFTGAIMAIQFHLQLKDFGAESVLGGLNTSGTLREVGPVLIAFMLAGKVGAYTSAELGTMKVTEQFSAVECLGINPLSYLVFPRFLAVTLSAVVLLIFGLVVSIFGGMLAAHFVGNLNVQQFLSSIPRFATGAGVFLAVTKSVVFGGLMGLICCANGCWTTGGSAGVGRSVRNTAVESMVAIVLSDFSVSWIFNNLQRFFGVGS
jgi:phospholipid/cholesterol/gamma-HCH transport system permease protein